MVPVIAKAAFYGADSVRLGKVVVLGRVLVGPYENYVKISKLWQESQVAYNDKVSLKFLLIYLQW